LVSTPQVSGEALRNIEEVFEDLSTSYVPLRCTEEVLDSLEEQLEVEVRKYLENLWEEVNPEEGDRLRGLDEQVSQRENQLRMLNEEIELERSNQDVLLKGLRAQHQQYQATGGGGGGVGGGGGGSTSRSVGRNLVSLAPLNTSGTNR